MICEEGIKRKEREYGGMEERGERLRGKDVERIFIKKRNEGGDLH